MIPHFSPSLRGSPRPARSSRTSPPPRSPPPRPTAAAPRSSSTLLTPTVRGVRILAGRCMGRAQLRASRARASMATCTTLSTPTETEAGRARKAPPVPRERWAPPALRERSVLLVPRAPRERWAQPAPLERWVLLVPRGRWVLPVPPALLERWARRVRRASLARGGAACPTPRAPPTSTSPTRPSRVEALGVEGRTRTCPPS
mmetsp:Transcript_61265/g.150747  ORF Transcript_61265/g.150747 Transcript_61265/m.150747 type:complete len:202 (+) Transcript_61265:219-824(+)